jgi:hypothetical protein
MKSKKGDVGSDAGYQAMKVEQDNVDCRTAAFAQKLDRIRDDEADPEGTGC